MTAGAARPGASAVTDAVQPTAGLPVRSWGDRAGVAAVSVTVMAAAGHLGAVLTRGLAAERVPWANLYEFMLTATLAGAVTWLVLLARRPVRPVGTSPPTCRFHVAGAQAIPESDA